VANTPSQRVEMVASAAAWLTLHHQAPGTTGRTDASCGEATCECPAGMMEGPQGFDLSSGMWENRGWRQIDALRRKLERLKELRELVRSLGRAGGRGPRRRAPEEVWPWPRIITRVEASWLTADSNSNRQGQHIAVRARPLVYGHRATFTYVRTRSFGLRFRRVRLRSSLRVGVAARREHR